ncbi:MAG: hypothetical protein AAF430_18365 [Myxococcota bacterium]
MPYDHTRLRFREVLQKRRKVPACNPDEDQLEAIAEHGNWKLSFRDVFSLDFLPIWAAWFGIALGAFAGAAGLLWFLEEGLASAPDYMAFVCCVVFGAAFLGYFGRWLGEQFVARRDRATE